MAHALALILALGAATAARHVPGQEPAFVAVIDPGHGGEKDGAIGVRGIREKDVTLQIARRLGAQLQRQKARVILTRTSDVGVPLAQRAALANARQADLFVSIHVNAMPGAASRTRGIETYFLSADATDSSATAVAARENADRLAGEPELDPADLVARILQDLADTDALNGSSVLAHSIHEELVRRLGADDRGVKQAPFYVLAGARMPAVLLEVGFVTNPGEARALGTAKYQELVARSIAEGIATWRRATARAAR